MSKVFCSQCLYFKKGHPDIDKSECHLVVKEVIPDTPIYAGYIDNITIISFCREENGNNDCINYKENPISPFTLAERLKIFESFGELY